MMATVALLKYDDARMRLKAIDMILRLKVTKTRGQTTLP
jgi:hypothetical protein